MSERADMAEERQHHIERRRWSDAARLCRDGDWLTITNEEAFFLAAHLKANLRIDSDGGDGWIVSEESVVSW